jgi:hypothetical protein
MAEDPSREVSIPAYVEIGKDVFVATESLREDRTQALKALRFEFERVEPKIVRLVQIMDHLNVGDVFRAQIKALL